jgi:hypothetical protein
MNKTPLKNTQVEKKNEKKTLQKQFFFCLLTCAILDAPPRPPLDPADMLSVATWGGGNSGKFREHSRNFQRTLRER